MFIIDTCSLIDLKRNYSTQVFVSLWSSIKDLIDNGELISLKEVQNELVKDDKEFWTGIHNNNGKNFFVDAHDKEIECLTQLEGFSIYDEEWAEGESMSDPLLICFGIANNHIVVTEENQRSERRIPYVCKQVGVDCINLNQFFEDNKWEF
ncbi:MAG: DUF4411 family protein [Methanobacterium sp.]